MSDKKSFSIQVEEILMEQIRNYPCLYNKSKMLYKEFDVSRDAWIKVAEKLDFMQNGIYKCIYRIYRIIQNLLCISSGKESKNQGKSFYRINPFFEMNWGTIARCLNRSGDIPKNLKIRDEEY